MDKYFCTKQSLLSLMESDEEKTVHIQSKPQQQDVACSSSSPYRAKMVKVTGLPTPQSPESPWTRSPNLQMTPNSSSNSLINYHCIASLHRGEGNIYSIAICKGVVFTGSDSSRVRAWKQPDCMQRGYLKAPAGGVKAISAFGNMLFTSHRDLRIRIWNFTVSENLISKKVSSLPKRTSFLSFSPSSETQLHKDCISCMAYDHDKDLLYTASHDKTVKAWRISDRKCVDSFVAHDDKVNSIIVNQNDGCLFTCSSDGSIKIWRRVYGENSHSLIMILKLQTSPVNAIVLCSHYHETTLLYSGSSDGTVNFWEKEKLSYRYSHRGSLKGHRFCVLCLTVVEKLIFSGSEDTTIRIWRREEGSYYHECLAVLDGHRGPVRCLVATVEVEKKRMMMVGFLVYSGSLDQTFKMWRVKVMEEEKVCLDYRDGVCGESRMKMGDMYEIEMSPILSPSWVEKKLQDGHF